jgi:cell division protein FtsN
MKTLITVVFLVGGLVLASAQQGSVNIQQDRRITQLLDLYKNVNASAEFYTIQVGFGTYEKAEKLKSDVAIDFPGWYSKIVFDSPTYRVHVGKFSTKLEAEREFTEVRKKYPESLILSPEKKPR